MEKIEYYTKIGFARRIIFLHQSFQLLKYIIVETFLPSDPQRIYGKFEPLITNL